MQKKQHEMKNREHIGDALDTEKGIGEAIFIYLFLKCHS